MSERPKKKVVDYGQGHAMQRRTVGWNEAIDAYEQWEKSQPKDAVSMPTVEEIRDIVVKALDIKNLKLNKEFIENFPMTILEICNAGDEIVNGIHDLINRKLKGE